MSGTACRYMFQKLILNLTNRCNLRCQMCVARNGTPKTLSRKHALDAAEFAERRGFKTIELTGGEPTLVDYFDELVERLGQVDAQIHLTTNGLEFGGGRVERLAGLSNLAVTVSVDGIGDVHDAIRRRQGAFATTERHLRALGSAGCRVAVNTTVQASNLGQVVDLYERFKGLKLAWHCFALVEDTTAEAGLIRHYHLDELRAALTEVRRRAQDDGNCVIISEGILRSYEWRTLYPDYVAHPGLGCTVVLKGLIVNNDGYVLPCFHYPWQRAAFRRLEDRTLDDIVDSAEYRDEVVGARSEGGCAGCSTACYLWDEEFAHKVAHPPVAQRVRYGLLRFRRRVRLRHPRVHRVLRSVKGRSGTQEPQS